LPPAILAIAIFALGVLLQERAPMMRTSGFQMLVWGFFVSTLFVYHGTFIVNSLAHVFGRRRFPTRDDSRNNLLIALITLGEGWHNNHHYAPSSERQGFYWWELDISHCILKVLSWCGLVWDLQAPPPRAYERQSYVRA
jgi:stearoyl-CoA desaturase (delta-9 desaturase)